jgi:hypothetical protein
MSKSKDDAPQEEYSVEKVLQKRTRNGKVRNSSEKLKKTQDKLGMFEFLGRVLLEMERLHRSRQHMGTGRELGLSRTD